MLECKSIKSKNNCIKLFILCTLSVLILWRDVRVAEGARLESVYRGNSIRGSNPLLSAIKKVSYTVTLTVLKDYMKFIRFN